MRRPEISINIDFLQLTFAGFVCILVSGFLSKKVFEGQGMDKLLSFMLYALWMLFAAGLLLTTFNSFRYADLNVLVAVLLFFALANTFLVVKRK